MGSVRSTRVPSPPCTAQGCSSKVETRACERQGNRSTILDGSDIDLYESAVKHPIPNRSNYLNDLDIDVARPTLLILIAQMG